MSLALLALLMAAVTSANITVHKLNNEKRLIQDLFRNYQVKVGRPVTKMTEKVVVYFGITLIQLIDRVRSRSFGGIRLPSWKFSFFAQISQQDERNQVLISNVHALYVSDSLTAGP